MLRAVRSRLRFLTLALLAGLAPTPAGAVTFIPLGDLIGGDQNSSALAVSSDGLVAVGTSSAALDFEAFRWVSPSGPMTSLGDLVGGGDESRALGTSADGSVVVGMGTSASGGEAFRWEAPLGPITGLGHLGGTNPFSVANAVSADGSIVVGGSSSAAGFEAFIWTQTGGMVSLGDFPTGPVSSVANGISADGSVVVGRGAHEGLVSGPESEAFRWTLADGLVGLGDLAGGIFESRALAVSPDGSVVVGNSRSGDGLEAFLWSAATGMIGLGDLPGGLFGSTAHAVTDDGVVVGTAETADGERAFIWTAGAGMLDLGDLIGAELPAGWALEEAFGISADGLSLVGRGSNADGNNEGWILRLDSVPVPEPGSALLLGAGLLGLALQRQARFS